MFSVLNVTDNFAETGADTSLHNKNKERFFRISIFSVPSKTLFDEVMRHFRNLFLKMRFSSSKNIENSILGLSHVFLFLSLV